jgi:Uma2 family endonuclease
MATAPTLPLVSVDEYLNSSYEYDMEFVDGLLVERSMPTVFHSLLQAILIRWFGSLEKEFRIKAMPELRTQIIERARYRVPDVLVVTIPFRFGKVLTQVPNAVVEILSPEDKQKDVLARFADYERLGVLHLIQLDPEEYVARRYERGSLIRTNFHSLSLPGRPDLPFDSDALFEQFRREVAEADLPGEGDKRDPHGVLDRTSKQADTV